MQRWNGKNHTFPWRFIHLLKLYSSMAMRGASKASNDGEKTKILPICCVFFTLVFHCFLCLSCASFLFLKLCQQAQGVLCNYRCFALCFHYHHPRIFAVCLPFQMIVIHDSFSLFSPPPFLCYNSYEVFNSKHIC